jgi:SAM-dependent methyltransferase
VTTDRAGRISRVCRRMPTRLALPLRRWHLRRMQGGGAVAMRMLLFNDPVTPREAEGALGEDLLRTLVEAGLLVRSEDGGIVSPFLMNLVNDLYVVCDDLAHGGPAVMGAGETTGDLCSAAYPTRKIGSALDLGCGAGTGALLFAREVRRVVGIDVNPRAITLARVNAEINGIVNAEFLEGDLFEPAADEEFDLIFSQPPFVAGPEECDTATYLHGGARGDEIAFRILAGLSSHLRPGGRAVVLVEWPEVDGATDESRFRDAVGSPELSVLILRGAATDLDEHCAWYAAGEHAGDLPAYERKATIRREHLERTGIRGLRLLVGVVQRGPRAPGWTSTVDIRPLSEVTVTSERIDRLLASRDLLAAGREALLGARLRIPDGTVFVEQRAVSGLGEAGRIEARFPDAVLQPPLGLNAHSLGLVSLVHGAPSVRAAAEQLAASFGATADDAVAKALPAVEEALLCGLLEPG